MKKLLMTLLLAASTCIVYSQFSYQTLDQPVNDNWPKYRYTFRFHNSNTVTIYATHPNQLQYMDVDSLFQSVLTLLQPLKDSLASYDAIVKVVVTPSQKQVAVKTIPLPMKAFKLTQNEMVQTKIDQDTLLIKHWLYEPTGRDTIYRFRQAGFYVAFTLNNITDVFNLPDKTLSLCKEDLFMHYPQLKKFTKKDMEPREVWFGVAVNKPLVISSRGDRQQLIPYMQFGIQHVRGGTVPTAGVGMQYMSFKKNYSWAVRLYWEPFFQFQRDNENRLITNRNDFITLRYSGWETENLEKAKLGQYFSFSLGYLAGRRGNWFEKNTFKVSFPGLHYSTLVVEPEFFFNKAFRNFSPSLKLTYFFE